MKVRKCAVAGQFYPDSEEKINELIGKIYSKEKGKIKKEFYNTEIVGGVVPHAGYVYSGYEAVHFFDILKNSSEKYDTIVILNPSHSGLGEEISIDNSEKWESPYGSIEVDTEFCDEMELPYSDIAQKYEHSGEVMLPFLEYFLNYDFKIVPVTINFQNYQNAKITADRIFEANKVLKRKIAIIASSDFSHYELPEQAMKHDDIILRDIKEFNSKKLYDDIIKNGITVCGYGPIMALMEYTKLVRMEPKSSILRRGSSGEVAKMEKVVDYISMLFY